MKHCFLALALIFLTVPGSAFTVPRQPSLFRTASHSPSSTLLKASPPHITLQEEEGKLPPPPEDHLVLAGDVLSIFVYGFTDHFLCRDCAQLLVQQASQSPEALQAAAASSQLIVHTPVWLENANMFFSQAHQQLYALSLQDHVVTHYSPLLETVGAATVLLAACWLLAGWWHRAFSFSNTVQCTTENALTVTARTWITCSVLLASLTFASHVVCGCPYPGLTKGDMDFIFDSLTVMTVWRFLVSYMLGYGGK